MVGLIAAFGLAGAGCGGEDGVDGASSSVQTSVEPAGANCPDGGIKVEVLADGVTQESQTQYICNGSSGGNGSSAAIRTSAEPAGANCPNGGTKVEVLADGVVQESQTQYICNGSSGENGSSAAIQTSAEPAGANCPDGGTKVEVLADGVVQESQTQYICNGSQGNPGEPGANGSNASIQTTAEPAGANCPDGGTKIEILVDGVIQEGQTRYVCNGSNGRDGCDSGYHDGGDGACVPIGTCATGHHDGGDGSCVPVGTCATAHHDGGDGRCVAQGNCSNGYHDDGTGVCVASGCAEGFHDGGDGRCAAQGKCSSGYHNNGVGVCVASGCASGFHDGGDVDCVATGTCSGGYKLNGSGACVSITEWISIPAGSFTATSTGDTVTLNAFKLAKTPTTVQQFKACVDANACSSGNYRSYSCPIAAQLACFYTYGRGSEWDNHPMNAISWEGADQYCKWIGGRLPTEDEWEYAATHDGTKARQTTYPWGNSEPQHCVTANYSIYHLTQTKAYCSGKTESTGKVGTSAVGSYSTAGDSPLGLVDMFGNVTEWTASKMSSYMYVLKGGSWEDISFNLTLATRTSYEPNNSRSSTIGFRCAK